MALFFNVGVNLLKILDKRAFAPNLDRDLMREVFCCDWRQAFAILLEKEPLLNDGREQDSRANSW